MYNELGAKVVRLHFYGFLEAMIPYFPPSCRDRLKTVCGNEIPALKEEVVSEGGEEMSRLVAMFWSRHSDP